MVNIEKTLKVPKFNGLIPGPGVLGLLSSSFAWSQICIGITLKVLLYLKIPGIPGIQF